MWNFSFSQKKKNFKNFLSVDVFIFVQLKGKSSRRFKAQTLPIPRDFSHNYCLFLHFAYVDSLYLEIFHTPANIFPSFSCSSTSVKALKKSSRWASDEKSRADKESPKKFALMFCYFSNGPSIIIIRGKIFVNYPIMFITERKLYFSSPWTRGVNNYGNELKARNTKN
jgi:hypothetical protein